MAADIQQHATHSMIWLQGYNLRWVGPHSLQAPGAMKLLALNRVPDSMIKELRRWSSNTWLQYMHGKISCVAHQVKAHMTTPDLYLNSGMGAED
jgi:hypothetical protein